MELTAVGATHPAVVARWATSAEESRRWCSRDRVTADDVERWRTEPDVLAYLALVDGEPAGYGELWLDDDEAEVELARLIVAPALRGRGLGRRMVALLTKLARDHHPAVLMRLHPDNAPALRCYTAAGFEPVPSDQADEWNRDQPVPYLWLRHRPGD
ncbi:GNAT family N-acetyltransferase [Verrucosispora sp. WMMC514]|uniref:GNAT family N-acetyltransferase n=1 Tax=Verrucosispora sp. WMMC514 TaxID=3015156 RepID=UPI00248B8A1E|nr:GNAT family N-acetyltransferase [Verrucosispora sp. WMMC514]WBB92823.1 GNAT family N-acetyltransferase [Verrucosispora sp. WMMC514]